MGNIGSSSSSSVNNNRRRHSSRRSHPPPPPPVTPQPEITANRFVYAAATPYPSQFPNPPPPPPPYYQYPGYYPPPPPTMPLPLPAPYDRVGSQTPMDPASPWVAGRYPCAPVMHSPAPYVDHQKAVTIRNDVNIKKETLRIEPDHDNPGRFLLAFTYDATVAGR